MPELPAPGTHIMGTAEDAKQTLGRLTGWPAGMIRGYAYLLIGDDGDCLCYGSNAASPQDTAILLRQLADHAEELEDWPDA